MQLEFVNVSGSEPWKNKEAKKFVRSHAMKDFRRRQREGVVGSGKGKSYAADTRLYIHISCTLAEFWEDEIAQSKLVGFGITDLVRD
jgi:hypothetical protein